MVGELITIILTPFLLLHIIPIITLIPTVAFHPITTHTGGDE